MNKLAFSLLLFFAGVNGWSQYKPGSLNNGIIPTVTPASPEASSLGKYGEWPVSQYTGVPNIDIPLYKIKAGSVELPIQLSYHAGGVKIDEVHAWVGCNWTLSAGGVITRTVVGKEDESDPGGFLYRNQRNMTLKTSYNLSNDADHVFLQKVSKQEIDTEPDMFYYNFACFSGKFYFDKQGQFQSIPVNSLKLLKSPIHNTLVVSADKSWEIADAEGNIYQFASSDGVNGLETTNTFSNPPVAGGLELEKVTAWYLTKITPADNSDAIYFDYVDKAEIYALPATHSFKSDRSNITELTSYGSSLQVDMVLSNGAPIGTASSYTSMVVNGKSMLRKIRWKNGEIIFDANTNRQDITSGKMLDGIRVNGKGGVKRKEVKLLYTYIQSRYFLSTLEESGTVSGKVAKHSFEYIHPESFPVRGSFAQDHWGFYNGAISNPNLLPANASLPTLTNPANREPNETNMQYGALKRITYPTGGYTEFAFEAHRYEATSPTGGGGPSAEIITASAYAKALYPQPTSVQHTVDFSIPFDQNNLSLTIEFRNYGKPPSAAAGWLPKAKIQHLVNQVYQDIYQWDAFTTFPSGGVQPNTNGLVDFDLSPNVNLTAGTYRLVTELICGNLQLDCDPYTIMPTVSAQIYYSVYGASGGTISNPMAGGLRIKNMVNSDGANTMTKAYTYDAGKLLIYPKYVHQYAVDEWPKLKPSSCPVGQSCNDCKILIAKYLEEVSTSQAILGFTQGSAVGYPFVREKLVTRNGDDNGYTDYTFTFTPDVVSELQFDASYWPNLNIANTTVPLTSFEYKRGLLALKEVYKKTGTSYTLIHSVKDDYDFNDNNSANRYNTLRALRVKKLRTVNYPCGNYIYEGHQILSSEIMKDFGYAYYDVVTSWIQKKITTEKTFNELGQNPLIMVTNYTYGNPGHLQVTSTMTTNSAGRQLRSDIKYPHDYASTAVYNEMVARNIIKPIEIKNYTNNILQQQRTNVFSFWNGTALILPGKIQTATLSNPLVTEVDFQKYDESGNLQQMTSKAGITKSYFWGYGGSFPVAEVLGKTYNEAIAQSGIDLAVVNNPATTDAAMRTELNKLRAMNGCFVTTYTYDPLIGITSQTDTNNRTTYYVYDAFSRLSLIRDHNSNVIKKYCYNYQGQTEDCASQ